MLQQISSAYRYHSLRSSLPGTCEKSAALPCSANTGRKVTVFLLPYCGEGWTQLSAMQVCCIIPGWARNATVTSCQSGTSSRWLAAKAMFPAANDASSRRPACSSRALRNAVGRGSSRSEDRHKIPRQAFRVKATPHNGDCGLRRIFCPNRAV